ncbi:excalibur calcium-binding domain-containing protein [Donghicola eburneus]|uniref:excalibur calcium-binding domain-containing protein n=1 Tax=Donghicola eburneus TaxID=393278 RepID=UPI003B834C2A
MKLLTLLFLAALSPAPAIAEEASPITIFGPQSQRQSHQESKDRTSYRLAQSWSCSPRRYCSKSISSCREARWYFTNCSWGGALDGDNDGVPCENLC